MSFVIVGVHDTATRLAVCPDEAAAAEYIASLPGYEDGRYYLDVCTDTVELQAPPMD